MNDYPATETLSLKKIKPEQTYPLRHRVLRPNQTLEDCKYPHDLHPDAVHVGAYLGDELISVASFYQENHPEFDGQRQYRLRGMATLPEFRKLKAGSGLLNLGIDTIRAAGGDLLWCNARTTVSGFYAKLGMQVHGPVFDIPPIGPHHLMFMAV